jgi:hypothetical protein
VLAPTEGVAENSEEGMPPDCAAAGDTPETHPKMRAAKKNFAPTPTPLASTATLVDPNRGDFMP